jgi:hypothetical protein
MSEVKLKRIEMPKLFATDNGGIVWTDDLEDWITAITEAVNQAVDMKLDHQKRVNELAALILKAQELSK